MYVVKIPVYDDVILNSIPVAISTCFIIIIFFYAECESLSTISGNGKWWYE